MFGTTPGKSIQRALMDDWIHHLQDLMQPLGSIEIKRMFGGHGVFRGPDMLAILVDGEMYLKADDANRAMFEDEGLPPFTYEKKGQPAQLSFYLAPAECLESPAVLEEWARPALQAAARATAGRRSKKKSQGR